MAWRGSRPVAKGPVLAGSDSRFKPSGRGAEEVAVVISLGALLSAPLDLTALGLRGIRGGALYSAVNGSWTSNGGGCWLGVISLALPCGTLVGPCPWLRRGFSDRDGRRTSTSFKVELQA